MYTPTSTMNVSTLMANVDELGITQSPSKLTDQWKFYSKVGWIAFGLLVILILLLLIWVIKRFIRSKIITITEKMKGPDQLHVYPITIKTGAIPQPFYTKPQAYGIAIELETKHGEHIRRFRVPIPKIDKKSKTKARIPKNDSCQTVYFNYETSFKFKKIVSLRVLVYGFGEEVVIDSVLISSTHSKKAFTVKKKIIMLDPPFNDINRSMNTFKVTEQA